jgi:mono/diheme cytochrome c family protein
MRLRTFAVVAICTFYAVFPRAQAAKSAEDGIYTSAQADRGKAVVEAHCVNCHRSDLGGLEGPALVGPSFLLTWEGRDLDALFERIRDTMPADAIGSISDAEKLDSVAYLLQQNGFPAGTSELSRGTDNRIGIAISKKGNNGPPRAGAVVRTKGCLTERSAKEWVLTNAEEVSGDIKDLRLLNVFPDPSAHKGHKVAVMGLFVSDPALPALNVLTLEMVSADCAN